MTSGDANDYQWDTTGLIMNVENPTINPETLSSTSSTVGQGVVHVNQQKSLTQLFHESVQEISSEEISYEEFEHLQNSRRNQNIVPMTGDSSTSSQSRYRQGEVEAPIRPIGTNDSDASSGSFIVCERERDTLSSNNSIGTARNLADVQDV